MSPKKDALDPDLGFTVSALDGRGRELVEISLVDAVANGKLFIQNNDGTFTCVELSSYWKRDSLLTVCSGGYEFNQDGQITRDWRPDTDRH